MHYHLPVMHKALMCLMCLAATVEAFDLELSSDALSQALATGQTGIESLRSEFHRPYRLTIGQPPLDYVDVITPFRRVVLAAEARLLSGERPLGQREALATLAEHPDQVDLRLELTFHPLNTFVGVPVYDVGLISIRDQRPMPLRSVERVPRFGPRVSGQTQASPTQGVGLARGKTQPLLGGVIVATFDGSLLDREGSYEVLIDQDGKTLARARIDLSALR